MHNRRIIDLMPELGTKDAASLHYAARPMLKPKRLDLLATIKKHFPAHLYDLWERSPVRADEDLDDAKAFLRLFPADSVLWIAPNIFQSGRPEHCVNFRTRTEWEGEAFAAPGTRIAPASFKVGSYRRSGDSVAQHLFTVIETDEIGYGKLYGDKDEFCSLIRWIREACEWHLAAVVDSGGKSLHAWFRHPGAADVQQLAEHAVELGLDKKFAEPSQPWRSPGVRRENTATLQCLVYLDLRAAL